MSDAPTVGAVPSVRSVAICIATYRRPGMLAAMLRSLSTLRPPDGARVRVVVVDNDEAGSAREVVDDAIARLTVPIRYAVEPVRNIARARNRAVRLALEDGADWVAFTDDDGTATPDWLAALLETQQRTGADAVFGPVRPFFPEGAPGWITRGRFFENPEPSQGQPLQTGSTDNALVSRALLGALDGPFDPAFGVSGGGDSHFFTYCHRTGARLAWAPDAVVLAEVPASRVSAGWILQRAFRIGNSAVFIERSYPRSVRRLAARAAASAARGARGAVLLLPAVARGRAAVVRALWDLCYAAGAWSALLGYRYLEYRRVHGR
jgi:succinoglycan biosynthesis protein ExoM